MSSAENYLTPIYREVQKFHPVFYFIVGICSLSVWIISIIQLVFKIPVGNNPAPDKLLIFFLILFGIIFPFIFLNLKLITEIRNDGIYVKMFPFHLKWQRFKFEEIDSAEHIKYSPLKDYGGWGIRYGKKGKAYNAKGNMGIMLKFKNKKNLLIGTQRGEEFLNILSQFLIK